MPQRVTVPEKTLEHWSSQYVLYRYGSQAALWWPAKGEDLDIRLLPVRAGKAVQLELKTATVTGPGQHDVWVDLGQLWDYSRRPLGMQPFYVVPWPRWSGELAAAASRMRIEVTELAFRRCGSWWFGNWLVVLTTEQVAKVLKAELAAHGSPKRRVLKRLVSFEVRPSAQAPTSARWGSGVPQPHTIGWCDFWARLERCGDVAWPQVFRLPAELISSQGRYSESELRNVVVRAKEMLHAHELVVAGDPAKLVTLTPHGEDGYRVGDVSTFAEGGPSAINELAATEVEEDRRQLVFLDLAALSP